MHEGLSIRPADESDLPDVLRLLAQPAMDDGRVLGLEHAKAVFSEICRVPNYRLYVAVQSHAVVGTFALLIMPNLGHRGSPSGVLEDIVVADGRHGTGIGRCMVGHAIALCRAKGCYKMVLSSNLRRTEAHAFYEHLGFERHGYSYRIDL
jgi:GNAT superfamily N-acetyltransferase